MRLSSFEGYTKGQEIAEEDRERLERLYPYAVEDDEGEIETQTRKRRAKDDGEQQGAGGASRHAAAPGTADG